FNFIGVSLPKLRTLNATGGDGDNKLGNECEKKAAKKSDGCDGFILELTAEMQKLSHDVQDGARGHRKEKDFKRLQRPYASDEGPQECRCAAKESHKTQESPGDRMT